MRSYDVIVIGGGIHGVGVAQAAAARGHSVALIEQRALAWGTSSRSSKLIHGGLRYLESAQLGVVRECLHERTLLLKLAPELVRLVPFHIPIYRETTRRPWQITAGLSLYAVLASFQRGAGFRRVPRTEWGGLDGLKTGGLQAVFQYWDGQTDDALLTQAVMRSAQSLGAELFMPAAFVGAELTAEGCEVHLSQQGVEQRLQAKVLVNASGPWVNRVLQQITPMPSTVAVDLVQGTHLVLEGHLAKGIYYLEAPQDRRAVFTIPWQDQVLLGTTEKAFSGDPAQVAPTVEEERYLLETAGYYFAQLRDANVIARFAGLRVLPSAQGAAFGRSRETILHVDRAEKPRLLSIYGGKLTAYRATAGKVMDRLHASLPMRKAVADTRQLSLTPS
ncbi:MAG: FAD-dependent oxidoreductase [Pseudomonadota bacterium]